MDCTCDSIGSLRHRVTIESPVYTQDTANEQIASWTTYATRWAACRAMTTREAAQAEQIQGVVGWVVEFPYDSKTVGITSGMRMKLKSFNNRVVYCDGPSMPVNGTTQRVRVRGMEQTA